MSTEYTFVKMSQDGDGNILSSIKMERKKFRAWDSTMLLQPYTVTTYSRIRYLVYAEELLVILNIIMFY